MKNTCGKNGKCRIRGQGNESKGDVCVGLVAFLILLLYIIFYIIILLHGPLVSSRMRLFVVTMQRTIHVHVHQYIFIYDVHGSMIYVFDVDTYRTPFTLPYTCLHAHVHRDIHQRNLT